MSDGAVTRQIEVDHIARNGPQGPASGTGDAWSFGVERRVFVSGLSAIRNPEARERPIANAPEFITKAPRQRRDLSSLKPVTISNPYLGKRAFPPTYHWEGVVESVNEAGFLGRLTPVEGDRPRPAQVEYAEFDYDDLSDPSERHLVSPGAVFYWTVGRSTNPAGTTTKQSLIRFRRLPPVSQYSRDRSARDAEALLRDLHEQ